MPADAPAPGASPGVRLRRPRAVIFDWDNTLVDSWHVIHDANNHTLVTFGLPPWTMEETRRRVRGSMRDTYPTLFGERWKEAGEVFYRRFAERQLLALEPLPGAAALLADLWELGLYLAVVSNKTGGFLRKEAAHLGWAGRFGRIVGAHDAPRDKPAPDPVHLALEGSGVAAGESVWFVGDADIDMECAAGAGCVPILIRPEPPEDGEFAFPGPAAHFVGCTELSIALRSL